MQGWLQMFIKHRLVPKLLSCLECMESLINKTEALHLRSGKGDDKRCDVASPCSQGTLAKVLVVWKSGNPAHVHAILS